MIRNTTVLLVEDDPAVRRMLQALIERAGYSVLAAVSGDEALLLAHRRAEEGGPPVGALVTDVIMPGTLDGPTLARRLRHRFPGLGVVCTSGFVRDALPESSELPEGSVFLQKPFQGEDLLGALDRVLDDGPKDSGPA